MLLASLTHCCLLISISCWTYLYNSKWAKTSDDPHIEDNLKILLIQKRTVKLRIIVVAICQVYHFLLFCLQGRPLFFSCFVKNKIFIHGPPVQMICMRAKNMRCCSAYSISNTMGGFFHTFLLFGLLSSKREKTAECVKKWQKSLVILPLLLLLFKKKLTYETCKVANIQRGCQWKHALFNILNVMLVNFNWRAKAADFLPSSEREKCAWVRSGQSLLHQLECFSWHSLLGKRSLELRSIRRASMHQRPSIWDEKEDETRSGENRCFINPFLNADGTDNYDMGFWLFFRLSWPLRLSWASSVIPQYFWGI